jgi:hypothetical protein
MFTSQIPKGPTMSGTLKEYQAVVNGTETTLRLTDEDAKARGLSGGKKLSEGSGPDKYDAPDPNDAAAEAAKVDAEAKAAAAADAKAKADAEAAAAKEAEAAANKARTAANK